MTSIHPGVATFIGSNKPRLFIVSGGQTGVDTAALDLALKLNLPCGGWCPLGRRNEEGMIKDSYPLRETFSEEPAVRTELNALDSDGTLILTTGAPTDGTNLTEQCATFYNKPLLVLDFVADFERMQQDPTVKSHFWSWISDNKIFVLNIAGPRESFMPGFVYQRSFEFLSGLFS